MLTYYSQEMPDEKDNEEDYPNEDEDNEVYTIPEKQRKIVAVSSEPTIKGICERIDKGRLKAQPEFQRKYVWKDKSTLKSKLIESVLLKVPIPVIYTAEEEDGSEVVIDGQQRLLTFHSFLRNEFKLRGLQILNELNGTDYKSLGEINESLQDEIDSYPIRVIKILKESHKDVRFDVFERLNRGSVKLNDQELRNCIYRGPFNDFLKEIIEYEDYQSMLGGTSKDRMQDMELALRFFTFYKFTYLSYNPPMKKFLNDFMKEVQYLDEKSIDEYRKIFKNAISMAKTTFGDSAFFLITIDKNKKLTNYPRVINKGLFDVVMFGFARYQQNQIMPYKDALKEELIWLQTANNEFQESITGAGTDSKQKVEAKFNIWLNSLKQIIGTPKNEPRCFSWDLKNEHFNKNPVCGICNQKIESVDDADMDHIEFYWRGGKTIPENARLVHRFCNRSRHINEGKITKKIVNELKDNKQETQSINLDSLENSIRDIINLLLSKNQKDYWKILIPDNVRGKVAERILERVSKHPYERGYYESSDKKLDFCDMRDYLKIILDNWNIFVNYFASKTEVEKHFNNLINFRNALKHSRQVNDVEKKEGEAAAEWIKKVIETV